MASVKESTEKNSEQPQAESADLSAGSALAKEAEGAGQTSAPKPHSDTPPEDAPKSETAPATVSVKVPATPPSPRPATAAKPPLAPKPAAAAKPIPPPEPFVPKPSIPVSMIEAPQGTRHAADKAYRFDGELDEDFDSALERVKLQPTRNPIAEGIRRGVRKLFSKRLRQSDERQESVRRVAFDGYRSDVYDEKLERDRRYGTVYSVTEQANAFLIRLEFPRKVPASSLKSAWKIPDEMPDYEYVISVADGVVSIRAGVRGEALRRLSYVSSSFPSDFLTRIELRQPLGRFVHRLKDKVLNVIVFKDDQGAQVTAA